MPWKPSQPPTKSQLSSCCALSCSKLILGRGRQTLLAESFGVGCVSLSMRYFEGGRITDSAFRAAQVAAGAELEEALEPFAPKHWKQALGSSGTAGAVSQLLQAALQSERSFQAA